MRDAAPTLVNQPARAKELIAMTASASWVNPVPVPDFSITLGATTSTVVTWICVVTAAACVIAAVGEILLKRTAVLLFCCIGGIFCNAIEPFWDVMGHLNFNRGNTVVFQAFAQTAFPVDYPLWAVLLYIQFGGFQCWVFYLMLKRGAGRRTFWMVAGWQVIVNGLIEIPLINAKVYQYYGDQPFRLFGFPLWWVFTNFGELLGAVVLYLLIKRFGNKAAAAAIFIVPAAFGAWELWAGWPVYAALNFDTSSAVKHFAALVSAAITMLTLWTFAKFMPVLQSLPDWHCKQFGPASRDEVGVSAG
ncbi:MULTISPECIES: hypothetical protein [Mycobacterium]|nr:MULTISPECIES: hypothetical protein [Mycobacterium]